MSLISPQQPRAPRAAAPDETAFDAALQRDSAYAPKERGATSGGKAAMRASDENSGPDTRSDADAADAVAPVTADAVPETAGAAVAIPAQPSAATGAPVFAQQGEGAIAGAATPNGGAQAPAPVSTPQPAMAGAAPAQDAGSGDAPPPQTAPQSGAGARPGQSESAAPAGANTATPVQGSDPAGQAGRAAVAQPAQPQQAAQAAQSVPAQAAAGDAAAPALRVMRGGAEPAAGVPAGRAGAASKSSGSAAGPAGQPQASTPGAGPQTPTLAAGGAGVQPDIAVQIAGAAQQAMQQGMDASMDGDADIKAAGADTIMMRQEAPRADGPAHTQGAERAAAPRMDAAAVVRLAQQIGQRGASGSTQFEIRMDPPELGRIDVRLHIDGDNKAHAVLLAERADTLADLSRAARALERALEDAGLKLAQGGLEFGLKRDAPQQGMAEGGRQGGDSALAADSGAPVSGPAGANEAGGPDIAPTLYGFRLARPSHIAIRI